MVLLPMPPMCLRSQFSTTRQTCLLRWGLAKVFVRLFLNCLLPSHCLLILDFWEISILTSIVAALTYTSTSSLAFAVCLLDDCHSGWVTWKLKVVLIYISFMAKAIDWFFMYLLLLINKLKDIIYSFLVLISITVNINRYNSY
jgi:hypothetical protein